MRHEVFGGPSHPARSAGTGSFWPPLIDLVTSALMVYVLVGFLDAVVRPESLEAAMLRARQDQFLSALRGEFASEIESGAIGVRRNLDFIQITFSDRVLFASGEYELQLRGIRLLARSVGVFRSAAGEGLGQIQVEGHTDSRPLRRSSYPADNWELSTARAIRVVQYLVSEGLPPILLSANGYADQRPVASNGSSSGRAKNRRIELRVFFSTSDSDDVEAAEDV